MAGPNYFDQFDQQPQSVPGFVPLTGGNPKTPLDLQHMRGENQIQQAEMGRQGALTTTANATAAEAAAKAKYADDLARAQRDKAVAEAHTAQANDPNTTTVATPTSDKHGEAYLQALPTGMAPIVRSVLAGNLVVPGNAYKDGYWKQVLQHAVNADPDFNAADFNIRARTRQSFTSGPMAANITALNTALGHAGQLQKDVADLGNWGGWVGGNIINPIANWWEKDSNPAITNFQNDARAYGGEKTNVFANGAGGQGERADAAASVPINGTPSQQLGVLTHDAGLFKSRIDALNAQYQRGMGKTADVTELLDPHARAVYQQLLGAGGAQPQGNGAPPSAGSPPPLTGGGNPPPPSGGTPPGWQGPNNGPANSVSLATGPTRLVDDPKASALVDSLIRRGAGADEINAAITPLGYPAVDPARVSQWQTFLKQNPGYKGAAGGGVQFRQPTTLWQRAASSPTGTGIYAGVDSILGGTTDEINGAINSVVNGMPLSQAIADANARKQLAFATNPKASLTGNLVGGALGYFGAGKLLKGTALATGLGRAAPYAGAATYGALTGAGQDNDNRVGGAVIGAGGGLVGQGLGELAAVPLGAAGRVIARSRPYQTLSGMFGRPITADLPSALTSGQRSVLDTMNAIGPDNVRASLADAQRLGVPMSLADTGQQASSLAGAAVRRSPDAAAFAESQLIPRNRGQIDRFGQAVTRDLGPVANIPQASADLTAQARSAAAPLYDAAYSAPGASSVDLSDLAQRPSMQAGLKRAFSIAKEEGRDPTSLGFDLDQEGNVTLNRVPSFQTLDYVKRGIDDTLEQYRNPLTGKLQLNEATSAINKTKADLLNRIDDVNPDYKAARAAYAGPVQARDALALGQDAFGLSPDELAMQVGNQSPEHLGQMQLGYRSELMNRANALRDVSNPFESTLGSPAARARIDTLYPGNSGTADLFRTRDLEQQLQRTTNDILGNSKTAQRQIADQAFSGSQLPALALDATLLAHGGVPVASIARGAAHGQLGDWLQLGIGRNAIRKADQIAPILLNTDPAAASQSLDDLIKQNLAYRAYQRSSRPTGPLGMFGSALGVGAATRP